MNMLEMAKDLIDKGNELNDPELVSMGMAMLEKYSDQPLRGEQSNAVIVDEVQDIIEPYYDCSSCGHTVPFDKPGRKKCPMCKKHTLILLEPLPKFITSAPSPKRVAANEFSTQIRQTNKGRIRYNEEGQPDGMYSRTEQVEGVTNVWDDDKTEGFDAANELLKKFTKVTPRTRKPPKMVKIGRAHV